MLYIYTLIDIMILTCFVYFAFVRSISQCNKLPRDQSVGDICSCQIRIPMIYLWNLVGLRFSGRDSSKYISSSILTWPISVSFPPLSSPSSGSRLPNRHIARAISMTVASCLLSSDNDSDGYGEDGFVGGVLAIDKLFDGARVESEVREIKPTSFASESTIISIFSICTSSFCLFRPSSSATVKISF